MTEKEKQTTSALLYLDGISVSFDGFKALNELSFIIEPGSRCAPSSGPNGAGKTTMMDVVTGKTRPDTGDVFFEEGHYDLSKLDETEIAESSASAANSRSRPCSRCIRRGQPAAGAQERPRRARGAAVAEFGRRSRAHRRGARTPSG